MGWGFGGRGRGHVSVSSPAFLRTLESGVYTLDRRGETAFASAYIALILSFSNMAMDLFLFHPHSCTCSTK